MLCLFCHQPMNGNDYCSKDHLTYYTAEELHEYRWNVDNVINEYISRHPGQPGYYFYEHNKFYTVSEMERIARLKVFL
jgi:hypothetical protein